MAHHPRGRHRKLGERAANADLSSCCITVTERFTYTDTEASLGKMPLKIYQSTQLNPKRQDCGLDPSNNINKDMAALRLLNQSGSTELEANTQELDRIAELDNTSWDKTPHLTMRFKILKHIPKAARPVTSRDVPGTNFLPGTEYRVLRRFFTGSGYRVPGI